MQRFRWVSTAWRWSISLIAEHTPHSGARLLQILRNSGFDGVPGEWKESSVVNNCALENVEVLSKAEIKKRQSQPVPGTYYVVLSRVGYGPNKSLAVVNCGISDGYTGATYLIVLRKDKKQWIVDKFIPVAFS